MAGKLPAGIQVGYCHSLSTYKARFIPKRARKQGRQALRDLDGAYVPWGEEPGAS